MSIAHFFRSLTAGLFLAGLPFGASAINSTPVAITLNSDFYQDKRDKKPERGRENKKPEVKEVPQSRRQEKPGEVKQEKKEKPQDNRRRN